MATTLRPRRIGDRSTATLMSRSGSVIRANTRFAVWCRDNLTCVYCGATAPAVRLSLDHIGDSRNHRSDNLVTACFGCNCGRRRKSITKFCEERGLRTSVVWRRSRTQTAKPVAGYRAMVNLLLERGMPIWLHEVWQNRVRKAATEDESDLPF